ncbi:HEAT repeat domain-containing protein [Candidatus Obscuribacterales bacterium]|nr:HEAT repeat domain-containing protein [Candidatus Obscuribacterales bacterium]
MQRETILLIALSILLTGSNCATAKESKTKSITASQLNLTEEDIELNKQVTPLLEALKIKNDVRQLEAMDSLSELGIRALPFLIAALDNESEEVKASVSEVIGRFGPKGATAVPKLVELVGDKNIRTKQASIWALGEIGKSAKSSETVILNELDSKDDKVVEEAILVLERITADKPETFEKLVSLAKEGKTNVREIAITVLPSFVTQTEKTIAILNELLSDKKTDKEIKEAALVAAGKVGRQASSLEALIVENLSPKDKKSNLKLVALEVLPLACPDSSSTVKHLEDATNDLDRPTKLLAIEGLNLLGAKAEPAEARLIAIALEPDVEAATLAIRTLEQISLAKPTIVNGLREASKANDYNVRVIAITALAKTKDKSVVPDLVAALSDDNTSVKRAAAKALSKFPGAAPDAVPKLIELLGVNDPLVRAHAVMALSEYGSKSKDAVSKLTEFVSADDTILRQKAAWCLGKIGPDAAPAARALAKGVANGTPLVRCYCAHALGAIGPSANDTLAVASLTKALNSSSLELRKSSAWALGRIGTPAKSARTALELALRDTNDEKIQDVITKAIERIGPDKIQLPAFDFNIDSKEKSSINAQPDQLRIEGKGLEEKSSSTVGGSDQGILAAPKDSVESTAEQSEATTEGIKDELTVDKKDDEPKSNESTEGSDGKPKS